MDNDSHDKLDLVLELTKENNRILRGMHRRMVWGQIITFLYWVIILGSLGWTYYYLQPYLMKYLNMYQNITQSLETIETAGTSLPNDLNSLLEKIR